MSRSTLALLVAAALVAPATTQVPATFATFGAGCSGTGTGLGDRTVLPASAANQFGSGNALPFGWSISRYQQIFDGAELPNAFTMAGLSLRQPRIGPLSNRFTIDVEIQVGYTTRTPTTMSATFANNFDSGAPVIVLPRSLVIIPDMVPTGPTGPSDFFFTIPWPATFDWVPAANRHFLMQVTILGNSYGGGTSGYAFDAIGSATTARLYGSPATATTGTLERGLGIVMGLRAQTHTAVPSLFSTNTPQINDSFRIRLSQARASSTAFVLLGFSASNWSGYALPLGLGSLGAPACSLLTSVDDAQAIAINAAGTGSFQYAIPNSLALLGLHFYNQGMIADPTANGFGFAFSNGGVALIGNQ